MDDHEHDRFLFMRNNELHYGCVNPYCGHGAPARRNHWAVPLETEGVKMRLLSHENRKTTLGLTWKINYGDYRKGDIIEVSVPDNLEDSKAAFARIFGQEPTE
jgi:hypothetical protein